MPSHLLNAGAVLYRYSGLRTPTRRTALRVASACCGRAPAAYVACRRPPP